VRKARRVTLACKVSLARPVPEDTPDHKDHQDSEVPVASEGNLFRDQRAWTVCPAATERRALRERRATLDQEEFQATPWKALQAQKDLAVYLARKETVDCPVVLAVQVIKEKRETAEVLA